jgi:hypothetical protein
MMPDLRMPVSLNPRITTPSGRTLFTKVETVHRLLVVSLMLAPSAQSPDVWERAEAAIVRLNPAQIPNLPPVIRGELDRRGCNIPQPSGARSVQNVLAGHFTSTGHVDWAVLCSRLGTSSILVFLAGDPARGVSEFGRAEDRGYLQAFGAGTTDIGFSRQLTLASSEHIHHHYRDYGGPSFMKAADRDGIEDIFLEKASSVWYWHRGRWTSLPGAD